MPLRHYGTSGTMGTTYSSAGAEWEAAELCGAVLFRCRCDRLRDVQGISLRGSEVMKLRRKGVWSLPPDALKLTARSVFSSGGNELLKKEGAEG
jgi:hypothetical protein